MLGQAQAFPFGGIQQGQGLLVAAAVALLLTAQFRQPLLALAQPFPPLLPLRLQGGDGGTEAIALLAAALLLLQPAAGAPGHIAQPSPRQLHRRLRAAAGLLGPVQVGRIHCLLLLLLLAQGRLAVGQLLALALQGFSPLLVLIGLPGQLPGPGIEAGQFGLHRQQLVLTEGFHLRLQRLEGRDVSGQLRFGPCRCDPVGLLLAVQGLLAPLQVGQARLGGLVGQHLLLQPAGVEPLAQVLVGAGLGAVALQFGPGGQQFLLHDGAALLPLLHLIELDAGLLDAGIKQGHAGQLIDDAAPIAGPHRHDAGHGSLHHHVAALGIDPQAPQLGLQLLQVAGHAIGAEAAGVGAPRRHPQPPAHGPFGLAGPDPGALLRRLQAGFGRIGLPFAQVEPHAHHRFGRLAGPQHGAVDQVGQAFGPHAAAVGQAQAEEHGIEDVALARAVGAGDDREALLQRDRHRSAKGLELMQLDLIDVNQQARAPSYRNLAEAVRSSTPYLG